MLYNDYTKHNAFPHSFSPVVNYRFLKPLTLSSGLEAGPLVLFNKSGPTLVVSAFSEFMTSSMWYNTTAQSLHWGIMGKAFRLPKGYETKTVLFYSPDGINKVSLIYLIILRLTSLVIITLWLCQHLVWGSSLDSYTNLLSSQ